MGRATSRTRISSDVDLALRKLQEDLNVSRVRILDALFFETPAVLELRRGHIDLNTPAKQRRARVRR